MKYIIDIPDELVTEHQLKLILTKEIKGGGCKDCKARCIECTHISVRRYKIAQFVSFGQTFGDWTVISEETKIIGGKRFAYVSDNLVKKWVRIDRLKSGNSKKSKEASKKDKEWHRLRTIYASMLQRCYDKRRPEYKNYGGRGILVSERLKVWHIFQEYVTTLVGYGNKGLELDRIDNNLGYEEGNLRWATRKENCRNRRTNRVISLHGKELIFEDFVELCHLKNRATIKRLLTYHSPECVSLMIGGSGNKIRNCNCVRKEGK